MKKHFMLVMLMVCGLMTSSHVKAKTFVYCSEASPEHFSPSLTTSGSTEEAVTYTIFNRLVEFEVGTTNIIPALAERWEVSEDGLHYTFYLRKNVKFHTTDYFKPTRDFNVDDVLFSFERQWHKDHPYHNVSGATYTLFNSTGMPGLLKEIKRIDDYTVEFVLNKPDATFLSNLVMRLGVITSKEYADQMLAAKTPEKFDQMPIGTGPYILVDYVKDSTIRYKANPEYWSGVTPIDDLVFVITPDAAVRFAKVKKGECHLMALPNRADIAEAKKIKDLKVYEIQGLNVGYLSFNTTKPPFDNPLVRKALNLATDKKAILEVVFQRGAVVAKGPIPPTMWGYDESVPDYPYDPEQAVQILKEAGIDPKSLNTDLWAMPVQRSYNPDGRKMAELIQADWKKIGIDINIVSFDWTEYLARAKRGEHTLVLLGMLTGGDPDTHMHLQLSCDSVKGGFNNARWCYEPYDKLVNEAKRVTDKEQRIALYKQAQEIFHEQVPWVPIAHSILYHIARKEVKDYRIDPSGYVYLYGVDIEE